MKKSGQNSGVGPYERMVVSPQTRFCWRFLLLIFEADCKVMIFGKETNGWAASDLSATGPSLGALGF